MATMATDGKPFINPYDGRWTVEVRPNDYEYAASPSEAAALQAEASARYNSAGTYYNGMSILIGDLDSMLKSQGIKNGVSDMMQARDAANGGTPFAYDPANSAWDASTQKAIQANAANPASGVAPQVTANIAKAINGVSLPAGMGAKTTTVQGGQAATESGYDPLALILGGVLFVLLIFLFASSAIKRGVSHGV